MNNKQYAFYFDQTRCMGCNTCTVACKDWNQVEPGPVRWRKQETFEINSDFFPLSMGCNHCEDPACVKACGLDAISKTENGAVLIDRAICQELGDCIKACPFNKPQIADDKQEPLPLKGWGTRHPAQKCTMCNDIVVAGDKPVCVKSCVARAMDFLPIDEIQTEYPDAIRLNPADFPYAYENNQDDTQPAFFVKKREANKLKIHPIASTYKGGQK